MGCSGAGEHPHTPAAAQPGRHRLVRQLRIRPTANPGILPRAVRSRLRVPLARVTAGLPHGPPYRGTPAMTFTTHRAVLATALSLASIPALAAQTRTNVAWCG